MGTYTCFPEVSGRCRSQRRQHRLRQIPETIKYFDPNLYLKGGYTGTTQDQRLSSREIIMFVMPRMDPVNPPAYTQ
jgi:hypothetical protein